MMSVGEQRKDAVYARVSPHDQKSDLDNQIVVLEAQSTGAEMYSDNRPGLNFERRDLMRLVDEDFSKRVSKIYVTYEDRPARFVFDLLSWVWAKNGTEIVVVNSKNGHLTKGGAGARPDYNNHVLLRQALWSQEPQGEEVSAKRQRGDVVSMSHPWKSKGEKRTIVWSQEQPDEVIRYLRDMQDAIKYALHQAYRDAIRDEKHRIPSPIGLRREVREWFYSRFNYARHHINPVCRTAVAMLRSYRKNHRGELRIPEVKRTAMRIDGELFRFLDGKIRLTLQPNIYAWLPINTSNKRYEEYSKGRPSELLITDRKVCLTFVVGDAEKPLGDCLVAQDLNFRTVDSTKTTPSRTLVGVETQPLKQIIGIQDDFSRRRRALQKHVKNPQKRAKKLRETRGRQRNRIRDALHKLSTKMVRENSDASFVFEDLRGIRKTEGERRSRSFRTYLNRWPYRLYQSMAEYKSPNRTLYVSPRGTSSECPVCGGVLEHPAWAMSRCRTCGADYDRDRLASLAILCRGLRLCGQPFAVSADASWRLIRDEYLYTHGVPEDMGTGGTDAAGAPNPVVNTKIHV